MAYRTLTRGRRAYTRKVTRSTGRKFGGTRLRRKYPTRRRRYPRKMSNKRILNLTSTKKKDSMVTWTNTISGTPAGGTSYKVGAATLDGARDYIFGWIPTARSTQHGAGTSVDVSHADYTVRTAQTCYMRGLKERIHIQTSSGIAWNWRRICFTLKGDELLRFTETGYRWDDLTSQGHMRVANSFAGSNGGSAIVDLLFEGTQNVDWASLFSAKVDNKRVSLKYDKTLRLQSGNQSGIVRQFNRWHGMNKNLEYDADEAGDRVANGQYSTSSRAGMGDYYVIDIIRAGTGGTANDYMTFQPEATLYWHEK